MRRFALRHPFLLLGLATLGFVCLAPAGDTALLPLTRVVVIPVWIGWTATMIVTAPLREPPLGGPVLETFLRPLVTVGGGLLPYLIADALLGLYRRGLRMAWEDFRSDSKVPLGQASTTQR